MTDLGTHIDELKGVYTFGSIYLTYIPINDLTHLLNEERKYNQLVATWSKAEALQQLRTFLNDERQPNMNEAIAFIQLDLKTEEAGFKKISDRNGTITKISWTGTTVKEVGWFSDRFLKRLVDFEDKHSSLVAGLTTVDKAWTDLGTFREDPFIPTRRMVTLDRDFKSLIERKSDELQDLKSRDHVAYAAIQDFSTKYDRTRAALKQDLAFEPIQAMIDQLGETRKKIHDTYPVVLTLGRGGPFRDPSEISARHLIDLGYSDVLKASGEDLEDFMDLYQTISVDRPAGLVTTQPLGKLDFSADKVFFGLDIGKLKK
jgi:hypothetical protein